MNRPGFFITSVVELRKLYRNIYFVGSDISKSEPGSIEGALSSGVRAAYDVAIKLAKERF
jgi:monoamine oxidase